MRKDKLSEFIYRVDLEHESAEFGVYNFKTFFDRDKCMAYVERLAVNNPDVILTVSVRPRYRKRNVLAS